MIPGNIDLTENLDFRNIRKRELPQLPVSWKGKDRLNTDPIGSNTITTLSNNNITWTVRMDDGTNMSVRNYRLVYHDDWISWNDYDEFTYTTTSINTTITDNTVYAYYDYDRTISSSSAISFKLNCEDQYDVFGNRIKSPKVIPKIPWDTREIVKPSYSIPWLKGHKYKSCFDEDYIPMIAWDTGDNSWFRVNPKRRRILSNPYEKAESLICWFRNKSRSFITREIDKNKEEEVDMSYLTNMSWIRVKDAVIDSI